MNKVIEQNNELKLEVYYSINRKNIFIEQTECQYIQIDKQAAFELIKVLQEWVEDYNEWFSQRCC